MLFLAELLKNGFLTHISSLTDSEKLQKEFPDLTEATGTLLGKYSIKLKDGTIKKRSHTSTQATTSCIKTKNHQQTTGDGIRWTHHQGWGTYWMGKQHDGGSKKRPNQICLDLKDLNQAIKREHYPMRTIEEKVAKIPGCKLFSKLDAKSGFLQI